MERSRGAESERDIESLGIKITGENEPYDSKPIDKEFHELTNSLLTMPRLQSRLEIRDHLWLTGQPRSLLGA
ncbi:hypothetical protein GCM10007159_35680 [Modicisalibacter luteus]|nr:hypothetical protein GCM10007159_35680 [Halomonas lutea]